MLQVRMITSKSLAEERVRSEHKSSMMVREDAKAIGAITALTIRSNRPSLDKRNPNVSWSECVSYKLDENGNKVGAHIFNPRTKSPNRRKMDKADQIELAEKIAAGRKITAADLAPVFAD